MKSIISYLGKTFFPPSKNREAPGGTNLALLILPEASGFIIRGLLFSVNCYVKVKQTTESLIRDTQVNSLVYFELLTFIMQK
jgi:hypothetical protein